MPPLFFKGVEMKVIVNDSFLLNSTVYNKGDTLTDLADSTLKRLLAKNLITIQGSQDEKKKESSAYSQGDQASPQTMSNVLDVGKPKKTRKKKGE